MSECRPDLVDQSPTWTVPRLITTRRLCGSSPQYLNPSATTGPRWTSASTCAPSSPIGPFSASLLNSTSNSMVANTQWEIRSSSKETDQSSKSPPRHFQWQNSLRSSSSEAAGASDSLTCTDHGDEYLDREIETPITPLNQPPSFRHHRSSEACEETPREGMTRPPAACLAYAADLSSQPSDD